MRVRVCVHVWHVSDASTSFSVESIVNVGLINMQILVYVMLAGLTFKFEPMIHGAWID